MLEITDTEYSRWTVHSRVYTRDTCAGAITFTISKGPAGHKFITIREIPETLQQDVSDFIKRSG